MNKVFDVIVVGAGHAGVEAALVSARMNKDTILVTLDKNHIASMPCNPSIGGPAKGVVVREIDALGGEMAKAADKTALQMKLLNSSRGPAVWALRAQSDKIEYSKYMLNKVKEQENLTLVEGLVEKLVIDDNNECSGILLTDGRVINAKKVILTTGTYMQSLVLRGEEKISEGPDGQKTNSGLSEQLAVLGFELIRLKTGTPPRVLRNSIDFSKVKEEPGSDIQLAFSYSTNEYLALKDQHLCWLLHSNENTHQVVRDNLHKSPMYSGEVMGIGPRYCPSFEDKIVRFADKPRHQIFLEPESVHLDTIYVQGFSTSMPADVQEEMIRTLPGLENCKIVKYAYAIEYDAIVPTQITHTLETKIIKNLYTAGQINGTSGYEEAACQGLMAGINAVLSIDGKEPFILGRDEAYIGVLIDDLVTKGVDEPYRLLTSRAEYRLLLRNDNAEERLKHYSHQFNLVDEQEWNKYQKEIEQYEKAYQTLQSTYYKVDSPFLNNLRNHGIDIQANISGYQLAKRPDVPLELIKDELDGLKDLSLYMQQKLIINIRFEGYIKKEKEQANKAKKLEDKLIPQNINYDVVENLAIEAREKFKKVRPVSIGQASRISGINPADIQMLLFYLEKIHRYLDVREDEDANEII